MSRTAPLALAVLCLLTPAAWCQDGSTEEGEDEELVEGFLPTDPRFELDPRTEKDPRVEVDQREEEIESWEREVFTLEGRDLFESLYADGARAALIDAMQEAPWDLLEYIDSQCDLWRRMADRDDLEAEVRAAELIGLEAKGRELALLADQGVGDTRFEAWVDRIYAWDAKERAAFTEAQDLLDQGVANLTAAAETPDEWSRGLTPVEQALERFRALGDTWGESTCLALIGRAQAEADDLVLARGTMQEALRIARQVRDLDTAWSALNILYYTHVQEKDFGQARTALDDLYQTALEVGDEETAEAVLRRMIGLNDFIDATTR